MIFTLYTYSCVILFVLRLHKGFIHEFQRYCNIWWTRSRYLIFVFLFNLLVKFKSIYFNSFIVLAELHAFRFENVNISFTSGKSYLLKMIANYVSDRNLAVCVSAPTGKLAARYKQQLPNCRCHTVHSNFTVPVGQKDLGSMNWSLSDIHVCLLMRYFLQIKDTYYIPPLTLQC